MGQTYTQLLIHVVFGTKGRAASINPAIRSRLHAYMGGIVREFDGRCLIACGTADHVHLLLSLPPKHSLSDIMRVLKANSSRWVRNHVRNRGSFSWQSGYSAFSVSQSNCEKVREYIANQEEHHRRLSFQDEVRLLLKKHVVEFDEKYLWD
jgi:putative transposase